MGFMMVPGPQPTRNWDFKNDVATIGERQLSSIQKETGTTKFIIRYYFQCAFSSISAFVFLHVSPA